MPLRIYNTLTGKKELFTPVEPGKASMYVCGPTVYDSCHIGHARSVVVFDVIARYLRISGLDVTYVRNFTDVDDKIINKANETGTTSSEIASRYIQEFHNDMDTLNVQRASMEPRATEHINNIIQLIEILIKKEFAYVVGADVFFSVESFPDYGKLSSRKIEDMEAGARVEIDTRKKNPFDFALWKSSKPGEPYWESPWGKGRPGWHIECSAMSTKLLGKTIDIHGGGKDLIFPHHENEIAQSEAAFGKPFVKYWVHNGFVNINQEKMSKSLGNFLMVKDVIKICHPEAVRLFLLSNHYRSPIDFTDKVLYEATVALDKIYATKHRIEQEVTPDVVHHTDAEKQEAGTEWSRFCDAMDDDFNTAKGVGVLFEAIRSINRLLDNTTGTLSKDEANSIRMYHNDIIQISNILGILGEPAHIYFEDKKNRAVHNASIDPDTVEQLIKDRNTARAEKDWAKADSIRAKLLEMNIVIEDRKDGTIWKVKDSTIS
jgi:cysteinyl-tRNA synthetase